MYEGILTCHLTFFLPHVLPCAVMCCRCMMHGFNLVLGSILAYPWAQELLVQAQRVVTYFRASHRPLELVRQAAAQFQISKGLHSANTTRFTSKHECTDSVATLQPAFQYVVSTEADAIKNADVLDILRDPSFWADLPKLNKLQEPLTKVIKLVQSNRTTLADVCRCVMCCEKEAAACI